MPCLHSRGYCDIINNVQGIISTMFFPVSAAAAVGGGFFRGQGSASFAANPQLIKGYLGSKIDFGGEKV